MPELTLPSLPKFAAEVKASLSSEQYSSAVECRIESGPDFKLPPFNLSQSHLGQLIYVVPVVVPADEACRQIADGKVITTVEGFHVVSDGRPSKMLCVEVAGATGEWREKLRETAHRHLGENWQMLCVESRNDKRASISLLNNTFPHNPNRSLPNGNEADGAINVWLAPVNRRIVAGTCRSPVPRPIMNGTVDAMESSKLDAPGGKVVVKKRVLRKVAKKPAPTATPDLELSPTRTSTECIKEVEEERTSESEPMSRNHQPSARTGNGNLMEGSTANALGDSCAKLVGNSLPLADGNQPTCGGSRTAEAIAGGSSRSPASSPLAVKKQRGGLVGKIAAIFNGRPPAQDDIESPPLLAPTVNGHHEMSIDAVEGSVVSRLQVIPQNQSPYHSNSNCYRQPLANGTIDDGTSLPDAAILPASNSRGDGEKVVLSPSVEEDSPTDQTPDSTTPSSRTSRSAERASPVRRTISMPPTPAAIPTLKVTAAALNRRLLSPTLIGTRFSAKLSPISSGGSSIVDGDEEQTLCLSEQVDGTERDDDLKSEDLGSLREDFSLASSMVSESVTSFAAKCSSDRIVGDPSKRTGPVGDATIVGQPSTSSASLRPGREGSSPLDAKKGMVRGMADVPVVVLQQVLAILSYAELAELRRVHPHWDELCGQFLNSGYYELLSSADRLLTDCQRRVHAEKRLAKPVQILTNLQVHVLNKVDVLRAPMDEGVLCFPYGRLLDQAFELLDRVQAMIAGDSAGEEGSEPDWEPLAELSRRAQVHYRRCVEREAERRMSEVSRLTVAHRLQRIDSYLSEANTSKLEKIAEKSREELSYEIEVLKSQNKQLRTDNRVLKQACSKLDTRVDVLERKFKLLGRLLGQ